MSSLKTKALHTPDPHLFGKTIIEAIKVKCSLIFFSMMATDFDNAKRLANEIINSIMAAEKSATEMEKARLPDNKCDKTELTYLPVEGRLGCPCGCQDELYEELND